jgi:alkyl sulfatase BDS1-like metallo-beta-lactamase superfamily hydrolase
MSIKPPPFERSKPHKRTHAVLFRSTRTVLTTEIGIMATPTPNPKPASRTIIDQQAAVKASLPFVDTQDFADTSAGLIGTLKPNVVKDPDGKLVWNNDAYDFLVEECPDTANPSLWRQSQLTATDGLFQVADGIYQVRGVDSMSKSEFMPVSRRVRGCLTHEAATLALAYTELDQDG